MDGRMSQTMDRLGKMLESEYTPFMRVLFGHTTPTPTTLEPTSDSVVGDVEWSNAMLNDSQKEAIRFALASREIALIHGPPGVSCSSIRNPLGRPIQGILGTDR
jgi:DNA polymerase alpha-associated DNA helicase A